MKNDAIFRVQVYLFRMGGEASKLHKGMGSGEHALRVALLGGCRVQVGDGAEVTPKSKKARAILAFLCLCPDGVAKREQLAGLLWSNKSDTQAKANLRQCLKELRGLLNQSNAHCLEVDIQKVRLRLSEVAVDIRQIAALSEGASPEDEGKAVELYRGTLLEHDLPDDPAFDDWLFSQRMHWSDRIRNAFERILQRQIARGAPGDAVKTANVLLAIDPAHEEAHRSLMRIHAARGDLSAAFRQYKSCADALLREYDTAPSPSTLNLYEQLRATQTNRTEPVQRSSAPAELSGDHFLSIAVLPLRNISGDQNQDYLGEGLTEDLVAALCRFRWLYVIARSSTSVYREQNIGPRRIGRALGVNYLVDGSVRRSEERIRIVIELIHCDTERTVWAEHYDGTMENIFDFEDEVVGQIVGQIDPALLRAESDRITRNRPEDLGAYEHVLQAIPAIYKMTYEDFMQAGRNLQKAVEIDPNYSDARAWIAFWNILYIGQGWAKDRDAAMADAGYQSRLAIEHDPNNALAMAIAGHVEAFLYRNLDQAGRLLELSLRRNRNSAFAWALSAIYQCYLGKPDEALIRMEKYRRLSPFDPFSFFFETIYCIAYTLAGRHEEAIRIGRNTVQQSPNFSNAYKPLISSLGHLGRLKEAKDYLSRLLTLEPDFTIAEFRRVYPLQDEEDMDRYVEGLRRAGVAEE